LPLPLKKERQIEILFVPLSPKAPLTKYKLSVLKNGTMLDLCNSLEQQTKLSKHKMAVCEVFSYKFYRTYAPSDPVSNIRDDTIHMYVIQSNN
jgi:ubiquitin carboxyl-terminal hydrolase 4/11/15